MQRITKETLSTAFQITAIIFLFSYSFSPIKDVPASAAFADSTKAQAYSLLMEQKMNRTTIINLSYADNEAHGLLYTRLNIVFDLVRSIPLVDYNALYSTEAVLRKEQTPILYAMRK